jgi:hypothetical protein
MKFLIAFVSLLVGMQSIAFAQKPPGKDAVADKSAPPMQNMDKPLPEMKGVVSWKTLGEVKPVKQKDKFVPEFAKDVAALDKKDVKLQGFMMPLDMGEKQARFILTSMPPSCAFCLPGGPEQLVEVQAKAPVKYGFEPILLAGKFSVLKDDPMGLYYRLTEAVPIGK